MRIALAFCFAAVSLLAQEDRPTRYFPNDPTGACNVISPMVNNWVLGKLWQCKGNPGVGGGTWQLVTSNSTNTILNGAGAPSSGLGNNGDFYINNTAHTIYGPKASGAWGSATALVGPNGSNGTNGTNGAGNNAFCFDATGSTTLYTCPSPSPGVTSLTGLLIAFVPQATNTAASSVNVAGLGVKNLKSAAAGCTTDLAASALTAGVIALFQYNGTAFCQIATGGGTTGPNCFLTMTSTVVTFTPGATSGLACNFGTNDTLYPFTSPSTATISGGTTGGTAKLYVTPSGNPVMQYTSGGPTITGSGMTTIPTATPTYPAGANQIATITFALSGSSLFISYTDDRPTAGRSFSISAGDGIGTITNGVIQVDASVARTGNTNTYTGANDFGAALSLTIPKGSTNPGSCPDASKFLNTTSGIEYTCHPANTWVAVGGGAATLTGGLWVPYSYGTTLFTAAAGVRYTMLQTGANPVQVTTVGFERDVAGTSGQNLAGAFYDSSCNKVSGSDFRTDLSTGSGYRFVNLTSVTTLSAASVYYFGWVVEGTTAQFQAFNTTVNALFSQTTPLGFFTGANAATGSSSTLTMPSACGSKSANGNPQLFVVFVQ